MRVKHFLITPGSKGANIRYLGMGGALSFSLVIFSSADFCQAERIWYRFDTDFHQNSLKLLLLLHFSMDPFETRYTYFLGQSSNFVLLRILKFGVSDFVMNFHQIFIEIATAPTVSNGFLWNWGTYSLSQSSHLLLLRFLKLPFFIFWRIFIQFSFKSVLLLQYLMDYFEIRYRN